MQPLDLIGVKFYFSHVRAKTRGRCQVQEHFECVADRDDGFSAFGTGEDAKEAKDAAIAAFSKKLQLRRQGVIS